MKITITLYFLCIILSFINSVFSHSNYRSRLYDIIRQSINKEDNQLLLKIQLYKYLSSTTMLPINQQINSMKNKEETKMYIRDNWDTDDDHYFKWASLNRRPMESLAGRKRSIEKTVPPGLKHHRINTGIWRSGLVG
ncbi:unnamed protein product [Rotaria sp. Silwood2]|nr:unnamed protein product [Rotaria sp. Silwood2]CAF2759669.1 unnamed protein product [Rotaria sp. Silwood2]CAF3043485.1 unnamed protein product [Rotaria sp. Silwood2]CAF3193507.1 unnamed protein product [Rotaria sp. Silwood2]CAF4271582.1 unnamed protein product [Rotaria sp. Silwood2]